MWDYPGVLPAGGEESGVQGSSFNVFVFPFPFHSHSPSRSDPQRSSRRRSGSSKSHYRHSSSRSRSPDTTVKMLITFLISPQQGNGEVMLGV